MNNNDQLIEALTGSNVYQEYERGFNEATGLPLALRPVESWQLPHHGRRKENPFCAMMAQKSRACGACLQIQQRLAEAAIHEPQTLTCQLGLCDTAVPVRLGERLVGYLQTGQVFSKKPTAAQCDRTVRLARQWGVDINEAELQKAYLNTRVLPFKEHEAIVKLLRIFAQHLSTLSNQLVVQQENTEPPAITRAKQYIQAHQSEKLTLGQVARAVNMSTFYFCKIFKKATGTNFTDYVSRVRVEKAINLLLNPNLRISEIAYEVGFQSLTHFYRVFKKILGRSPTEYRGQLKLAA